MGTDKLCQEDLLVKACAAYIVEIYHHHVARDQLWVHVLPFHTAIIKGNLEFVKIVVSAITNQMALRFFFNARIASGKEEAILKSNRQMENAYLDMIQTILSTKELEFLDEEIATVNEGIYTNKLLCDDGHNIDFGQLRMLALASANKEMMGYLWENGLNVTDLDQQQNNIFHDVVELGYLTPTKATAYLDIALECVQDTETRITLLHSVNRKGFRPIELAFKRCVPEVIVLILNLDGVYRHLVTECMFYQRVRYDLRHYEGANLLIQKSPLYYLTEFTEDGLFRAKACGLLTNEPVKSWINCTTNRNKGHLFHFFIFWMILLFAYLIQLMIYLKDGSSVFLYIQIMIMASFNLVAELSLFRVVVKEMWDAIWLGWFHGHVPVTFTFFYRFIQTLFCIFILINVAGGLDIRVFCQSRNFVATMLVITVFLAFMSVLFFMQFYSGVSQILVIIQKMLWDTCIFLSMIFVLFFGFAFAFFLGYAANPPASCMKNFTMPTKNPNGMNDLFSSLYTTLLYAFSVMAPLDVFFEGSPVSGFLVILYILLVLVFNVIMMNLLIAVMTNKISSLGKVIEELVALEKLSIILYVTMRRNSFLLYHTYRLLNKIHDLTVGKIRCSKEGKCVTAMNRVSRPFKRFFRGLMGHKEERTGFYKDPSTGEIYLDVIEITLENHKKESNAFAVT